MKQSTTHHLDRFTYKDTDLLGQGSFGRVYKGIDSQSGKEVAIKIMDMSLFTDQFMVDALRTEISVMKELHHPHVVELLDTFGDANQTILVLEMCNGDLRSQIDKAGGMFDEQTTTDVLQQLMFGFQEMVKHGYIHRDIKPENALVHSNTFKVADFGFATKCDIHGRQLMKDCVGTPLYMAPQLLERGPYTAKSDIWSIGVLTYEMLYGRQPWPCRDLNSYVLNMKNMSLRFPFEKPVSEEMKDFIRKALTVDEAQRIGWDEVFNHPILKKKVSDREFVQENIDDKSKKILAQIQQLVQARNIDIKSAFQKFDQDKGGQLDGHEFFKFISELDPRVTQYDSDHLLRLFDTDNNGTVSFDEFKRLFTNFDFGDLNDRAGQIITDLKEIIKANKLNLADIFQNFDGDKEGNLDLTEFTKLIKVIAPGIKQEEVIKVFKKFDVNGDGRVSFEEFRNELVYAIPGQDAQFNPQDEKAKKLVSELKRIVKENNVDVQLIFQNFDKNGSNSLDLGEFSKLCQVVVMDKSLRPEEQAVVFKMVDKNNDGNVAIEEFKKLFI